MLLLLLVSFLNGIQVLEKCAAVTATPRGFPLRPTKPISDSALAISLQAAIDEKDQGVLDRAIERLGRLYFEFDLTADQRQRVLRLLEPWTWARLRACDCRREPDNPLTANPNLPSHRCGIRIYRVQAGDTLGRIARRHKVPYELLMRLNRIDDPRRIRPGQPLRLIDGPLDVLVELDRFALTVLWNGRFVRRFPIGIGRADSTPTGVFQVGAKLKNPEWPDPESGQIVPAGTPDNPLGSRWIGIGGSYGIHGTSEPQSIGKRESRGCVRMHNRHVEELFGMLIEGESRVFIHH